VYHRGKERRRLRVVYPTKKKLREPSKKSLPLISTIHYGDILILTKRRHFVIKSVMWIWRECVWGGQRRQ